MNSHDTCVTLWTPSRLRVFTTHSSPAGHRIQCLMTWCILSLISLRMHSVSQYLSIVSGLPGMSFNDSDHLFDFEKDLSILSVFPQSSWCSCSFRTQSGCGEIMVPHRGLWGLEPPPVPCWFRAPDASCPAPVPRTPATCTNGKTDVL